VQIQIPLFIDPSGGLSVSLPVNFSWPLGNATAANASGDAAVRQGSKLHFN